MEHLRQIAEQVARVLVFRWKGRVKRVPEILRGKYQYFTQADATKLRQSGYSRPMTPLAEAVRDYVQGYLVTAKKLGE